MKQERSFIERAADRSLNDIFIEFVRECFSELPDDFQLKNFKGDWNKSDQIEITEFMDAYRDWKRDLGENERDVIYTFNPLKRALNCFAWSLGTSTIDELRQSSPQTIYKILRENSKRGNIPSIDTIIKIQRVFTPFEEL